MSRTSKIHCTSVCSAVMRDSDKRHKMAEGAITTRRQWTWRNLNLPTRGFATPFVFYTI